MNERDAVLVSVMAYAGLRPGEALALTWGDIHKQTILVNKAVSLGEEKDTKTSKERSVPLRKALGQDLKKWRLKSGRPNDDQLIFPAKAGGIWQDHDYRNWRKRNFTTAVEASGIACSRPYDLRHCCASLRFAEGINPVEIANEMGHSLETLLRTYTHVIKELAGQGVVSGDDLVRQARRVHILVTRRDAIER
jgi:integrase